MAYEFLKKLFGTPKDGEEPKAMTYAELEAAIDADKKIQVVDVKAGGYVSKEKLVQKFLNKWTIFLFCSILFSSNQKEH